MGVSALELRRRVLMAQPHRERKTGGIVSFKTHVPQVLGVSVPLSPVQAGTGDPYPPGGGKNKYPIAIGEEALTNNGGATHSNDNGSLIINTVATSSASGVYGNSQSSFRSIFESLEVPFTVSVEISATASGNVRLVACGSQKVYEVGTEKQRISVTATSKSTINFNIYGVNNGATLTVSNLQIEEGSTATDYAPYSNIRPITGWTGATAYRTGKNILDPGEATSGKGLTLTKNADGSIGVVGTPTGTWIDFGWHDVDIPAGTYMLSIRTAIPCTFVLYYYLVGDSTRKFHAMTTGQTSKSVTFDGEVERVCLGLTAMNTSTEYDFNLAVQLEPGATASDYAPYSGESYPVTFPETVYVGTLDAVNGVLKVTHAMLTKNTADMNSTLENYPGWSHSGIRDIVGGGLNVTLTVLSNIGTRVGVNTTNANDTLFLAKAIYGKTKEEWVSLAIDVQVVAELAEPIIIPLTPAEIRALMGENNVFSDAGDVEVEFWTN